MDDTIMTIKVHNSQNDNTIFNTKNWIEHTRDVQEILEKNMVATPTQDFYNEGDYVWRCVRCEDMVDEGQNYCHNCGQKLLEWD